MIGQVGYCRFQLKFMLLIVKSCQRKFYVILGFTKLTNISLSFLYYVWPCFSVLTYGLLQPCLTFYFFSSLSFFPFDFPCVTFYLCLCLICAWSASSEHCISCYLNILFLWVRWWSNTQTWIEIANRPNLPVLWFIWNGALQSPRCSRRTAEPRCPHQSLLKAAIIATVRHTVCSISFEQRRRPVPK